MGISYNSKSIVKNGLIFCVDAASRLSYNKDLPGPLVNAQALYTFPGTYTFGVPANITQISAVVVGAGGAGGSQSSSEGGGGGGGGAMAWGTIDVTPLEDLTVVVGEGGECPSISSDGGDGGDSQLKRSSTVLLQGGGGSGGEYAGTGEGGVGGTSSGTGRDGGGEGGNGGQGGSDYGGGGAGAAGYEGDGGDGNGSGDGEDGAGGGGGGAGSNTSGSLKSGGGVGLLGEHDPIENGSHGNSGKNGEYGSGGEDGSSSSGGEVGGGGGGGKKNSGLAGADGGDGGVRIVYKPTLGTRQYPTLANIADTTYISDSANWNNLVEGINNGTLTNGPAFSSDNYGSIIFDGDDDKVELGSINSSNPLSLSNPARGGLTISFAINWTQAGDNYPRIIDKSNGGNGENGWGLWVARSSGAVGSLKFSANNADYSFSSSTDVTPETWEIWTLTHVDATDGAWVWYKDGISDNSGTQTYNIPSTTTNATIGSWNHSTGREFKGKIGFISVYDRALSAAEVLQNYNVMKVRYD